MLPTSPARTEDDAIITKGQGEGAISGIQGERMIRVPGEIKRSRDLRGGRWSWTLTFAQKRS